MRIVHIITRLILGGAQQNTVTCCAAQVSAGHQVSLIYGPIYGPEGSLLTEAQKTGATLLELPSLRRPVSPPHDLRCYLQLRRRLGYLQPDIVHTHSSKAGILGRAAAWAERVPGVIHTIHGLAYYPGQSRLVYGTYVLLERWAARRCHRLIGVTQAMCDSFQRHGIGAHDQFAIVPSGIEVGRFVFPPGTRERVRRELGVPLAAPLVGSVARLDKLKGQDDLLDVLPQLRQRHPAVRLLFVGGGWNRENLEARVSREGCRDQVIFTGLVEPGRVAELLAAMDVKVLPSYQEGQPRALIQALLCGCAIVGYDAGGIPEICLDGQTGRLVPAGDQRALAEAICELLEHPEERNRLVTEGREYVRRHFDHRIMVRRLEEIYGQVLAKGPRQAYSKGRD